MRQTTITKAAPQSASQSVNKIFINNIIWFGVSFGMAFLVWIFATSQADPIVQQAYDTKIPVQVLLDDGMTVVDQRTTSVDVIIRAQESVHSNLNAEDIVVIADLHGYPTGTHTVELETEFARRGTVDTRPRQITVTLEDVQAQQVQIEVVVPPDADLPTSYTRDPALVDESQVTVRGVASKVQQVVEAQAVVNLSNQRDTYQADVRLIAVDTEGNQVEGVTIEPQYVQVTIPIRQRRDVRLVEISPQIDASSLAEGYVFSYDYEPQTVYLVGTEEILSDVQTPLTTEEIDLTGRTQSFDTTVPITFPDGKELPILNGQNSVHIYFTITAQTTTRQFDNIPLEVIGLPADGSLQAQTSLQTVVLLITGPQVVLNELDREDMTVFIDLNGLQAGTYELTPMASITEADIDTEDVSINPATVTVTLRSTAEATPPVTPGG